MKEKKLSGLSKQKRVEKLFIFLVLLYPMLQFSIMYVGVNANSILLAFKKYDFDFNVSFAGFDNFSYVFKLLTSGELILIAAKNSIVIFVMTLIIGLPLNMLFSYYLFKGYFAHQAIRFVVMLPSILSGMVMSLLFLKFVETSFPEMMNKFFSVKIGNLLEGKTAVGTIIFYMLWTGFTTSLILYPNAMNAIDDGIIESAQLDGVNTLQELWYIIMPLIYPTITTFFVTGVAALFTNGGPLFAFYYNDAPANVWTMGYYLYVQTVFGEGVTAYPFMSALGLMLTLITVPLVTIVKNIMEKFDPAND